MNILNIISDVLAANGPFPFPFSKCSTLQIIMRRNELLTHLLIITITAFIHHFITLSRKRWALSTFYGKQLYWIRHGMKLRQKMAWKVVKLGHHHLSAFFAWNFWSMNEFCTTRSLLSVLRINRSMLINRCKQLLIPSKSKITRHSVINKLDKNSERYYKVSRPWWTKESEIALRWCRVKSRKLLKKTSNHRKSDRR